MGAQRCSSYEHIALFVSNHQVLIARISSCPPRILREKMANVNLQNQVDSAMVIYMEDYLDFTENMPNSIARLLSRIHEMETRRHRIVKFVESSSTKIKQNVRVSIRCSTNHYFCLFRPLHKKPNTSC